MEKSAPNPYLDKPFIGYVLNSEFSPDNKRAIAELQQQFTEQYGGAIYSPEPDWLHVTLMDWLAPLVDYGRDKDEIFKEIFEHYDERLESILRDVKPIDVVFNKVNVSPEAIFISGHDEGQYQHIRQAFVGRVALLPNTKQPPKIIHSTIARFNEVIDLGPVQEFGARQQISLKQTFDTFRLIRSTDTRMEKLRVIKRYMLR